MLNMDYLIRHGQTNYNVKGLYQGEVEDSTLSKQGRESIRTLSKQLEGLSVRKLLSSPSKRAIETSEFLSNQLILPLEIADWLGEVANPKWSGMDKKYLQEMCHEQWQEWRCLPHQVTWGSSVPILSTKRKAVETGLREFSLKEDQVFVSHDHTLRCLALLRLGVDSSHHRTFVFPQGSVSLIAHDEHHAVLRFLGLRFDEKGAVPVGESKRPRIIFVRHGVTQANAHHVYQGRSVDLPLVPTGIRQIQRTKAILSQIDPDLVVSSSLIRARESTEILGFSTRTVTDTRLNEFNYGHWAGLTRAEVMWRFPQQFAHFSKNHSASTVPGAESTDELTRRVDSILHDVLVAIKSSNSQTCVIVAHDFIIRLALCRILGLDSSYSKIFPIVNGGVSLVEYSDFGFWRLLLHNATGESLRERSDDAYL